MPSKNKQSKKVQRAMPASQKRPDLQRKHNPATRGMNTGRKKPPLRPGEEDILTLAREARIQRTRVVIDPEKQADRAGELVTEWGHKGLALKVEELIVEKFRSAEGRGLARITDATTAMYGELSLDELARFKAVEIGIKAGAAALKAAFRQLKAGDDVTAYEPTPVVAASTPITVPRPSEAPIRKQLVSV